MDQTAARKRARELNDSGEYDSTFDAVTKSDLFGSVDSTDEWVVVEKVGRSTLRIVEE